MPPEHHNCTVSYRPQPPKSSLFRIIMWIGVILLAGSIFDTNSKVNQIYSKADQIQQQQKKIDELERKVGELKALIVNMNGKLEKGEPP